VDLPQRVGAPRDVEAGAEVDHQVERRLGERHRAHVGADQRGGHAARPHARGGLGQQPAINVDRHQARRAAARRDHRQRHAAATADLQDAQPRRRRRERQQVGDVAVLVRGVAAVAVWERAVLEAGDAAQDRVARASKAGHRVHDREA
jgi:hypothetical protein